MPPGYRLGLTVRGKDYEYDGTDAALPNAPYPMKGVGPFTHTDPRDRPPEIFGGKNTLHFGDEHGALPAAADHSAEQMNAMSVYSCASRRRELGGLPLPFWGEGWGEGVTGYRETKTPHPTPLPMGEGAERVRRSTVLT